MKCGPQVRPEHGVGPQRGAVLVAVLVCLLIVMLLSAALVRGLVVQHRLAKADHQKLQAFWFAESTVQRAIAQLQASPDYKGETWQIQVGQAPSTLTGNAVIRVESVDGQPNRRLITIEARSPNDPLYGVLQQRQIDIDLSDAGESS